MHPAAARRVSESAGDQEDLPVAAKTSTAGSSSDLDSAKTGTATAKRLQADRNSSAPAKKSKVSKSSSRLKVALPLQKGQKKLSAFFRV